MAPSSVHGPISCGPRYAMAVAEDLLPAFLAAVSELEREKPNTNNVPAVKDEAGAGPRQASPLRRGIVGTLFVHGRGPNDFVFILDSGAAVHATGRYYLLEDLEAVAPGNSVRAAGGKDLPVRGRGRVSLENITVDDVDYIPGLVLNIVSVSKLTELDYEVKFKGAACFVRDARYGGALVGMGRRVNGVYVMDCLFLQSGRTALDAPSRAPAAHGL